MKMKTKALFLLIVILVTQSFFSSLSAQIVDADDRVVPRQGWYFGVEGGLPLGFSTFSSFGYDKTHFGFSGGIYAGYRFNPVLSAEVIAKYGKMTLTEQDCCAERNYWLGMDGVRYNAPVSGMEGWQYKDLQSRVNMGQYGARLNVNLLGFFNKTKDSRWSIALSPHIYGVSTKSSIQTVADGSDRIKGNTVWHLGYGGDLQVACQITRHLQLGIYSGATNFTGSRIDAMPIHLHKSNFVLESGIRLGFVFGKNKKKTVRMEPGPVICPEKIEEPISGEAQKEPVSVAPSENTTEPAEKEAGKVDSGSNEKAISFPDIYFGFNSKTILTSEENKLQEVLSILNDNPEIRIIVKGWCDSMGKPEVNKRYSEARAKSVQSWLVERGIAADRIESVGMGSDFSEADASKARRASTTIQKN